MSFQYVLYIKIHLAVLSAVKGFTEIHMETFLFVMILAAVVVLKEQKFVMTMDFVSDY